MLVFELEPSAKGWIWHRNSMEYSAEGKAVYNIDATSAVEFHINDVDGDPVLHCSRDADELVFRRNEREVGRYCFGSRFWSRSKRYGELTCEGVIFRVDTQWHLFSPPEHRVDGWFELTMVSHRLARLVIHEDGVKLWVALAVAYFLWRQTTDD